MEFFQEDGDINDEASDVLLGQNTQARSSCCNVTHHNSRLDHERNDDSFTVLIFCVTWSCWALLAAWVARQCILEGNEVA